MTFHTILIAGHLGLDPEMHYTPTGQAVTHFPLAANRQYTGSNDQGMKETTWFRVSTWGRTAEYCALYLHKGSLVLVEGRLVGDPQTGGPRLYTHPDGSPASSFEVSANTVSFLEGREEQSEPAPLYDDLPF